MTGVQTCALPISDLEDRRNRLVSFIYQNMEFETEENLGDLIQAVREAARSAGGPNNGPDQALMVTSLDLADSLHKKPQNLSKGELQRGIIALAVSYGSHILMMDEPVFALEERHKQQAFGFLREWSHQSGTSLIFSAHDIHLCRDFADAMLLLFRDKQYLLGPVGDICKRENLEAAYRVPLPTLYQKQNLYRDMLRDKVPKA